jgi:hypothetical protein
VPSDISTDELSFGPFVIAYVLTWSDRDSRFSFFQYMLVFVLLELGGRLWELKHHAEQQEQRLTQLQGTIALRLREVQDALDVMGGLGDRLLQIKGVSLDITEQRSAIERKIDSEHGLA